MLEELRRHREMVQERIQKSFESEGLDLNILKAEETEIFKAQETEEQEVSVTDLIKAGVLEYDDSIEKAVYADTPQNRKLGRVGQEYHRGRGKKIEEKSVNKKNAKIEEKKSKISSKKVLSLMENSSKFAGEVETLVEKHLGKELMKKYGTTDMADIFDIVGGDNYNSFMNKMISKLPSDELSNIYKEYSN